MTEPTKYNPTDLEEKWYAYWLTHNYFHSTPDDRTPYTIVIPPPNVTGVLHMGHMLNNTIQDVLIRRARLKGFNACWVPGTDHASIATEAKVVAKLKEQGIKKSDLTREEFLVHAWEWTHQYGGVILEQLKKLGCSCDWERTKFTMDAPLSASVIKVFVDLYNKGEIYRGHRMVNWDPEAKTTLSDEEVIYEERQGFLYHLKYQIEGTNDYLIIATTRPETIFGDTAICINPNDERWQHLKGKKAIVPICNRVIPIIEDEYVDTEFGTGCLKVTPAHDPNDKVLGDKHQLEVIDIFNDDASLNQYGLHYAGKDRFVVRKEIVAELEEKGLLAKKESYTNKVGTSERTKAVIEPRLSDQWFLKMDKLIQPAIKAVLEDESIKLYPKKFENTYRHWVENVRDWNISRQLWWGQQIPAYYYGEGKSQFVVAETKAEALVLAKEKSGNAQLTEDDLRQDEDALDTWFSSWLWPMSVFNGILEPNNPEINYYYPTNDLVTGPDILFFWVTRMIVAGYEYKGARPFSNVYLTGLVRDKQRRKMSKSLGNSPDALKLIADYGADGVRVGLLLSSAAGNDLLFDEALCQQGKGFGNKLWNAFQLVKGWQVDNSVAQPAAAGLALQWFDAKFNAVLTEVEDHFEKYRISDALMAIYKLAWDDFCAWLLEMVKPEYGKPMDKATYEGVVAAFENLLKLLHPFMPFLTEEIWQNLATRTPEQALIVATYPAVQPYDEKLLAEFDFAAEVIAGIRTVRKEKNIPFKTPLSVSVLNKEQTSSRFNVVITKMGGLEAITEVKAAIEGAMSFRVKANEYFIPMEGAVNVEEELKKLQEELVYTQGFLNSVRKKLSNEKFVSSAPAAVVDNERKKEADALAKIATIEKSIQQLSGK
ncbi:valine--tRNA ligase [Capnocytophaga sp. Marseille-Q4570]|uniref:Valine--tRNA ligase n=1 Tax=Capnocytophaga bilenii TaxID=2819369 RepID=A0ABS3PYN6_9FLAO|nr:valine--tRNA ligase [Capnocytophaga bilenii]MBO1884441.1 valine--tRNA ligase [Capnocytophaga bilenii]